MILGRIFSLDLPCGGNLSPQFVNFFGSTVSLPCYWRVTGEFLVLFRRKKGFFLSFFPTKKPQSPQTTIDLSVTDGTSNKRGVAHKNSRRRGEAPPNIHAFGRGYVRGGSVGARDPSRTPPPEQGGASQRTTCPDRSKKSPKYNKILMFFGPRSTGRSVTVKNEQSTSNNIGLMPCL